jgi:hypothetical protein
LGLELDLELALEQSMGVLFDRLKRYPSRAVTRHGLNMQKDPDDIGWSWGPPAAARKPRGKPRREPPLSGAARARRYRDRQRSAGLRQVTVWQPDADALPARLGDAPARLAALEALTLHVLVAIDLLADEKPLQLARKFMRSNRPGGFCQGVNAPSRRHWERLLERPMEEVIATIIDPGPKSTWLRQYSPFNMVVTANRRHLLRQAQASRRGG